MENLEWCTYSENERHSYRSLGKKNPTPSKGKRGLQLYQSKPVKICKCGVIINLFESIKDMARYFGVCDSNLGKLARKNKKYKGLDVIIISREEYKHAVKDFEGNTVNVKEYSLKPFINN